MRRKDLDKARAEDGELISDEILAAAGITYRQLDYWCRTGLLDFRGGTTSGDFRVFAPIEADVAALLGRLSSAGLAPNCDLARRAVKMVRKGKGGVVSDGPLTVFVG